MDSLGVYMSVCKCVTNSTPIEAPISPTPEITSTIYPQCTYTSQSPPCPHLSYHTHNLPSDHKHSHSYSLTSTSVSRTRIQTIQLASPPTIHTPTQTNTCTLACHHTHSYSSLATIQPCCALAHPLTTHQHARTNTLTCTHLLSRRISSVRSGTPSL